MRQIRRGVFETNSSSVHSITMCSGEEFEKFRNGELWHVRDAVSAFLWYTRPVCKRKSLENYITFCTQYHKHALISSSFVYEKQYVYNLETECHTYIANNYLVHNCHEDSTPDGKHGNILNLPFLDTMLPFAEIAIGGGNPLEHPDLVQFLYMLREKNLVAKERSL